jgi:hypothetical protein
MLGCPEEADCTGDVHARPRFQCLEEHGRAVDPRPREEPAQDSGAAGAIVGLRHVRVFRAHLRARLGETFGRGAEDRKIDVEQQVGVGVARGGRGFMPRREHERAHAIGQRAIASRGADSRMRPLGAARLVVFRARVVHGIVEPQRELHLRGPLREHGGGLQVREALPQVLQRMVVALPLAVGRDELVEQALRRDRRSEFAPQALPGSERDVHGCAARAEAWRSMDSRTSRPSSITAIA